MTPAESRAFFDGYSAAIQAESERGLRTPKGDAARKARNAAMLARMRQKNPRRGSWPKGRTPPHLKRYLFK